MYIKRVEVEDGIFNTVVSGEFQLDLAEQQFIELLDEAIYSGATKVLIDGRRMTGNPSGIKRFLYGEFAAWAALDAMREHEVELKFAYVIHEPLRDPKRFGETVAVNRGMNVKTFDMDAAVEWLMK